MKTVAIAFTMMLGLIVAPPAFGHAVYNASPNIATKAEFGDVRVGSNGMTRDQVYHIYGKNTPLFKQVNGTREVYIAYKAKQCNPNPDFPDYTGVTFRRPGDTGPWSAKVKTRSYCWG